MTPFCAYLINTTDSARRYFITFANREVADEWWRFISTHSSYAEIFQRISPQFYAYDADKLDINTFSCDNFVGKMFFNWLCNKDGRNMSIAPPMKITDHISGKWYFVRSVADPRRCWYTRLSGRCLVCKEEGCDAVHVSTEHRTRFCMEVHNPSFKVPKDLVMIGADEVSITASKDYILRIDNAEELKVTKVYQIVASHLLFLFGDLKNRFVTCTEEDENGGFCEYVVPVERGFGEAWELVE